MALALGTTASAQQTRVTGTVTGQGGTPLGGVAVRVLGSDSTARTNDTGVYTIGAPGDGTLSFAAIGYTRATVPIAGRTTVNVAMQRAPTLLEQVVVTGYSEGQRRSEITGAVASVNVDATARQTSASVAQRLDATVSGVTVAASGSPGSRSTVRIRGISSFQNNDPLYIVDGTPVQDTYVNFINPSDIASIQVLKDASASSIYGSRASNGVIIIETNKTGAAGPPRVSLQARTGMATPYRGLDDIVLTNSLDYFQVVRQSYLNAGFQPDSFQRAVYGRNIYGDPNNPTVPEYLFCGSNRTCTNVDPAAYSYPGNLIIPGSSGTNWWNEVFRSAPVSDVNLSVAGSGTGTSYAVSLNYFDQSGTAIYNRYRRGSLRANTSFKRGRFTIGENATVTGDRAVGGLAGDPGAFAEGGILGRNILMQPVVPVRDAAGNFAAGKAQGLGNQSNPVRNAFENRNVPTTNGRVFGNVFGNYDILENLALRTTLGGSLGETSGRGYVYTTPENSEPNTTNQISENTRRYTDLTWSNTLRYNRQDSQHNLTVLLGQEINRSDARFLQGQLSGLVSTDPDSRFIQDALGNARTKNVFSTGERSALLSFFGKADYTFAERYTASFTLRRDGSSRLGPTNQWGTFPAVGLGWQISKERFLANNPFISDAQLRVGYGVTGNQQIPTGRVLAQFGGDRGATFYDIAGSGTGSVTGYRLVALGNEALKWEENRSVNAGLDLGLLDNRVNVIVDVYDRVTDNLLFNPPIPATAGVAAAPILNVGKMRNRGTDFSVGYRTSAWSASFNGSHYRNKILRIGGGTDFFFGPISTRFGNQVINQVGEPIGAFFGYESLGFFRDATDVTGHAKQNGAAPGRIKFRDVNGDGQITLADRTIIGSPHPDFTGGLDLTARRGRWDVAGTLFGTLGNEIFDTQKEAYVFRNFSANVRKDLLENSWTPETADQAKYPRLDVNDTFSQQLSSFYVEDGSYLRMRSLQLGYTLPQGLGGNFSMLQGSRIYLQGENLFTITGYDGLDPALPAASVTGPAGDIRDQYRGIDRGSYPTSRTFSVGIAVDF